MIDFKDNTMRHLDILTAQSSFHEKLIQSTNLRGNDLYAVLDVHSRYLEECFNNAVVKGVIHLGPKNEPPVNILKKQAAAQLSEAIVDKIRLEINKYGDRIEWEAHAFVMLSRIPMTSMQRIPIRIPITFGGDE